jgi:REP-associated tyrosine transposase
MARPLRIAYPNAYYHVTCRGNDRRAIFKDDGDRRLFLEKLKTSLEIYGVKLHAYVLMSNHFHLLVETPKANLAEFMRHFNISYTGSYNRRHKRIGHLYQGRYKAIVVEKDSYLLELSRYVHLNPVRVGPYRNSSQNEQLRILDKYPWSSLAGYGSTKEKQSWVSYDEVLGQLGYSRSKYREFISDGLKHGYATPWDEVKGQSVLGDEEFLKKLKDRIRKTRSRREQPALRVFETIDAGDVLKSVSRYFRITEQELSKKRTLHRDYRAIAMELVHRHTRISQEEIGKRLGNIDYSTVSRERKRLRDKMESDQSIKRSMEVIAAALDQR